MSALSVNPPIGSAQLERLRLALRRTVPSHGLGAHLHRRMGQSLEFREHRAYTLGDDIRKVDWLASARRGRGVDKLVIRAFEAEERRTLFVLVDCRPAMLLPEGAEKMRVAFWIALCLVHVALAERDQVLVGTLFGPLDARPMRIEGRGGLSRLRRLAASMLERQPSDAEWSAEPQASTEAATAALRPASAVAIISDMLFDDRERLIVRFARAAQRSYRSLHIVQIDSWPMERSMLSEGPFRLGAIEGAAADDDLRETREDVLRAADRTIERYLAAMRRRLHGPALVWPGASFRYPDEAQLPPERFTAWFRRQLPTAPFLGGLLSRTG